MRRLCTITPALLLALLPALLAGWAVHEHGVTERLGGYDCEIEHLADGNGGRPADEPRLYGNGEPHRHECVGCMAWGERSLVECAFELVSDFLLRGEQAPIAVSLPPRQELPSSRCLRGPPV